MNKIVIPQIGDKRSIIFLFLILNFGFISILQKFLFENIIIGLFFGAIQIFLNWILFFKKKMRNVTFGQNNILIEYSRIFSKKTSSYEEIQYVNINSFTFVMDGMGNFFRLIYENKKFLISASKIMKDNKTIYEILKQNNVEVVFVNWNFEDSQ